ncbi:MAG: carboxypeptidase-like regulatory domain-containing protein, partial [Planctomycetota bacterium]
PSRIVAKLFHESTEAEKVQRGYGVRELEQVAWLNDDGFFQFMGVEPGRKMLRVWWQEAGRQYYFAEQIFDLPAGELLDLGNIAIDAGMPLQISLPLVDRAGLPVDAADWVEQPDEGGLVLSVDGWNGTEVEWPSFGASVLAPLGGEMTLHGLPLGHVTIELHTAEEFNLIEGTGASIDLPRQTKVWTTDTSFVELPSVLRHMVSQGIVARFPEGMQPVRGEVHVLSRSSGERHTSDLRRVAGASAAEGGLMLEPGEYTVVVHTQTLEEPESGESWYGTWDGILGAGETVEVQVRPAATFEGQLVDEQGLPVAGRRLYFASGAFVEGGSQAWTHCVQTDDRGWFQLRGLEPGRTYRSARGLIVAAGGAGEITSGSLTLEARRGGANR